MSQRKKSNFIEWIYIFSVCLALILHVFNTIKVSESIKLFHIPALFAAFLSLIIILKSKLNLLNRYLIWILILTIISSCISLYSGSLMRGLSFLIVVGSTLGIPYVDKKKLLLVANCLLPIALLGLFIASRAEDVYRFQGFYEDPNYLCTTLLVFLYIILNNIHHAHGLIRILFIAEILIIVSFVLLTISRTGLVCIVFLLTIAVLHTIKKHYFISFLSILVCLIFIQYKNPEIISTAVQAYSGRENEGPDNVNQAAHLRFEISKRGIQFVFQNPKYLLLGIGIGATAHHEEIPGFKASTTHGDHNTITSCFTEQGIVTFALFILVLFHLYRILYYNRNEENGYLSFGVFIAISIFSLSINQMLYLPYWFLLLLLYNSKGAIQENR